MTAKEKLKMDAPALVSPLYDGGAVGCPHKYGYLDKPDYCDGPDSGYDLSKLCAKCWDREIPDTADDCVENSEVVSKKASEGPHILDSGNRRKFESGAVRDIQEGKGRCDLLPLDVVAIIFTDHEFNIFRNISKFQETGRFVYLVYAILAAEIFKDVPTMLLEVAIHFEEGAKKYGENNWQKGIPVHCYIDSAVRHYLKFLRGDKDEPHDRAFCWNLLCAIWTCKHRPELNEYSKEGA